MRFLAKNKEIILKILIFFALFLYLIFPYSDKDWGWHFKYGEYLFTTGSVLREDIFSWTMPGYQWTNHSWLYDPLLYVLYSNFNFIGLSVAGAIVCILAFFIIVRGYHLSSWKLAVLAFFYALLSESVMIQGLRSQVISLLFFSLLMWILTRYKESRKTIFFLPLLFLLWANFHGTFLLGLLISAIFLTFYFFKEKDFSLKIPLIFITCLIAVLINPFTYHVYLEGIKHFSNPYLKEIIEWQPPDISCSYCHEVILIIYLVLMANFVYKRRKIDDIPYILVLLIMTYLSFSSRRYISVLGIVSLPLACEIVKGLTFDLRKYKSYFLISFLLIAVLLEYNLFSRLPGFNFYAYNENNFCAYTEGTSPKLVPYLEKNPPKGKGFNDYNSGGYYIGKGIPAKLFIDGRMHLWERDGYMAFADYNQIFYQQNYNKFKEFNFDWVIVPVNSNLGVMLGKSNELGTWELKFQDNGIGYFVKER